MKKLLAFVLFVALAGGFSGCLVPSESPKQPAPAPVAPKQPDSKPKEPDTHPRKPWGPHCPAAVSRKSKGIVRDGSKHEGQEVQVDLPADQLVPNCGGSDGVGLCVFTSIMFSARLQNVPQLKDFQQFMKSQRGGGWPQKVDVMIAAVCKQSGQPIPDYIQVENGDWNLVKLALRTGRMPAITWGGFHMVNIVKLENGYGAFRDNNYVGAEEIAWMSEDEAEKTAGGNHFWSVILLAPRPPAPPKNGMVATCSAPYVPGAYEWRRFPDCFQWALWRDGKQVGAYDGEQDFYGEHLGDNKWGKYYRRPPVNLPPDAYGFLAGRVPGGVFFQSESDSRYSRNGVVISREEAFAALQDDSAKLSLTVIGTREQQDSFRAAYVASDLASRFVYQSYTPDEWSINTERFGFAHDGEPTIYLQKPDGEVLLHLRGFDSQTLSKLRTKDPSYNPALDPPLPEAPIAPDNLLFAPLLSLVAVAVTLLILTKESK